MYGHGGVGVASSASATLRAVRVLPSGYVSAVQQSHHKLSLSTL